MFPSNMLNKLHLSSSTSSQTKHKSPQCSYHTIEASGKSFTIDRKYSFERVIGNGAYGVVIRCKVEKSTTDKENSAMIDSGYEVSNPVELPDHVAIKMISCAFHDEIDAKRILREIKLLKHFRHHNVISILDMIPPPPTARRFIDDFNDVYIVADLMETDLHRIIYSKQPLSIQHTQYFTYQILCGLKNIHSAGVIHRDLKPSNLLINADCLLKICDFGLARGVALPGNGDDKSPESGGSMLLTEYVVTRWYRAPEIMLACNNYSEAIDIWGVGCVFAELLHRKALFPGDDYIHQVSFNDY